jgi:hypothetical protein
MVVRARHASVVAMHDRVADLSTLPDGKRGASCTCLDQELPEQRAVTAGFLGAVAPDREVRLGRRSTRLGTIATRKGSPSRGCKRLGFRVGYQRGARCQLRELPVSGVAAPENGAK